MTKTAEQQAQENADLSSITYLPWSDRYLVVANGKLLDQLFMTRDEARSALGADTVANLARDEYETILSQIGQAWVNQGVTYPPMVRTFAPALPLDNCAPGWTLRVGV